MASVKVLPVKPLKP